MAIALGQSATASAWDTSCTTSGVATTASGSTFIIIAISGDGACTFSDSKSNSYTTQTTKGINSNNQWVYLAYKQGGTGGSGHTFTVTPGGTAGIAMCAFELTGAITSGGPDQTTTAVEDTQSAFTIQSITPVSTNTLVINAVGHAPGTATTGTSGGGAWSLIGSIIQADFNLAVAVSYRTVGSPTAVNDVITFTNSGPGAKLSIAFAEAAAGGGVSTAWLKA